METLKYFIFILLGLVAVAASWYGILLFMVFTISYIGAKAITKTKKVWNGY